MCIMLIYNLLVTFITCTNIRVLQVQNKVLKNKRPRGPGDLLCHCLDKRISVRYKLSSKEDPWIFKSKVDTRSSKMGNDAKLTLWWKVIRLHERLASEAEILVSFALRPAAFDIQLVGENRRFTEWRLTELQHLTVKVVYTHRLCTYETQILVHFALRPAFFDIQGHRKFQMHWVTSNWTWTLRPNTHPEAQIVASVTIRLASIRDTRSSKIGNAPNDPKLNLST